MIRVVVVEWYGELVAMLAVIDNLRSFSKRVVNKQSPVGALTGAQGCGTSSHVTDAMHNERVTVIWV